MQFDPEVVQKPENGGTFGGTEKDSIQRSHDDAVSATGSLPEKFSRRPVTKILVVKEGTSAPETNPRPSRNSISEQWRSS